MCSHLLSGCSASGWSWRIYILYGLVFQRATLKQENRNHHKVASEQPQPCSEVARGQHLPVEHIAQSLVPDTRVHRGTCLPGH